MQTMTYQERELLKGCGDPDSVDLAHWQRFTGKNLINVRVVLKHRSSLADCGHVMP